LFLFIYYFYSSIIFFLYYYLFIIYYNIVGPTNQLIGSLQLGYIQPIPFTKWNSKFIVYEN